MVELSVWVSLLLNTKAYPAHLPELGEHDHNGGVVCLSLLLNTKAYPAHLPDLGEHDHNGGVVLPEHPPEVLHRLVQRALGGDVGIPVPEQK